MPCISVFDNLNKAVDELSKTRKFPFDSDLNCSSGGKPTQKDSVKPFVCHVCQEETERADIISSITSDHSAITLHFNCKESQKHGHRFAI